MLDGYRLTHLYVLGYYSGPTRCLSGIGGGIKEEVSIVFQHTLAKYIPISSPHWNMSSTSWWQSSRVETVLDLDPENPGSRPRSDLFGKGVFLSPCLKFSSAFVTSFWFSEHPRRSCIWICMEVRRLLQIVWIIITSPPFLFYNQHWLYYQSFMVIGSL